MTVLLIVFIGISTLVWLSVYGYLIALWMISARRHRIDQEITDFPHIAIVIPTLNEEDLILPKLKDLKNSDYPETRMSVLVVDGGSSDKTTELVKQEIEQDKNHNCWDCWMVYMNERKVVFGLKPKALLEVFKRG